MTFDYTHRIIFKIDGERIADLDYYMKDDVMHVNAVHTDPEHQGHGYARKLVDEMARYARDKNYKVMPICPYVVAVFDKSGFEDIDAR